MILASETGVLDGGGECNGCKAKAIVSVKILAQKCCWRISAFIFLVIKFYHSTNPYHVH